MARPALSIVIRTLDAADTLGEVLGQLRRDPDDQLIVVDSGSTDGTVELARGQGAEIVPIARGEFTYGRALNRGFAAARHAWVLSLSAHTVPAGAGFLDAYRRAIGRFPGTVTAAVGPILGEFDAALSGGITYFEGDDLRRGFGFGAGNPNSLYRADAWRGRPFDEEIGGGEDLQWYFDALAAGETIAAVHAAGVHYRNRRSMRAFYRKGRVDFRAMARFIEPHRPSLAGLVIRAAKLALYVPMGRVDWSGAKGSLAHCLGTYLEARALARRADRRDSPGESGRH
ncbi:MAG: glycosyltransferase [Verrucomicrobiota bacterium]